MRIKSHTIKLHLVLTAASIPTLGLAGTFLFLMWREGRATVVFTLFITPFLLMGLLLGYFGLRGLLRLARFGSWELEVPNGGGRFGVPLRVTLFPSREATPTGELQCRFQCVRSAVSRARGTQGTSTRNAHATLWEESWTLRAGVLQPRLGLELTLPMPASGQPTSVDQHTGSGIRWELNVVIPASSHAHEAMFEIPVSM